MFYTYLWLRDDGTPYYVGKGKDYRAFDNACHSVSVPSRDRIILQEFESEKDAFEAERFLIAFYGRKDIGAGCLRNLTDGGEGPAGRTPWNKGKPSTLKGISFHTIESRLKIAASKRGKKRPEFSDDWKRKLSANTLGLKRSEETCRRMRTSRLGIKFTQAHIQNQRDAQPVGRSGHRGIQWDTQRHGWKVRIYMDGKKVYVGCYTTLDLAIKAGKAAQAWPDKPQGGSNGPAQ
jgi:hypothetical protein